MIVVINLASNVHLIDFVAGENETARIPCQVADQCTSFPPQDDVLMVSEKIWYFCRSF